MKIKYSFVCDAANVSQTGNLNVLGIFNNISAAQFPAAHARMAYAACIEFHLSEIGIHKFKVNFIDEDGRNIIPQLEGEIQVTLNNLSANILLDISNLVFQKPGTYAVDLTIGGKHLATDEINLYQIQKN